LTFKDNCWKFKNLGQGHNENIEKGVLAAFKACDNGKIFTDEYFDPEFVDYIALGALYNGHKNLEKLDGSWIDHSKPPHVTFTAIHDFIRADLKELEYYLGHYVKEMDSNPEMLWDIAKHFNLSMDQVAVLCGFNAAYTDCYEKDDFVPEKEEIETLLCLKYALGIVTCFETKKRKRDENDDSDKDDEDLKKKLRKLEDDLRKDYYDFVDAKDYYGPDDADDDPCKKYIIVEDSDDAD